MLSVHPRHFKDADGSKYAEGWCNPGSSLSKERGSVSPAVPVNTLDPKNVAIYLAEFCVSPIIWEQGKRKQQNFACAVWIALDFDDGKYTLKEALDDFKDHACVIGTTKSHGLVKGDKPACDRFRVFVLASRVFSDADEYKRIMQKITHLFNSDKACVDAARYFYPCKNIVFVGNSEGEKFDVDACSDPPAMEKARIYPKKSFNREFKQSSRPQRNKLLDSVEIRGFYEPAPGRNTRHQTIIDAIPGLFDRGLSPSDAFEYIRLRSPEDKKDSEIWNAIRWWEERWQKKSPR